MVDPRAHHFRAFPGIAALSAEERRKTSILTHRLLLVLSTPYIFYFETEQDWTNNDARESENCDRYEGPKVEKLIQVCTPQICHFLDAIPP